MAEIDATNAGLFSALAYGDKGDPIGDLAGQGWVEDPTLFGIEGENQFRVFVNSDSNQVVIAFKGTNSLSQFKSDLADSGASEYAQIHDDAQTALSSIQNVKYPGYNVLVTGHSLGGGMAQSFALQNGLDGFGQNSLPIAQGTITNILGGTADVTDYRAAHQFIETNVAGDPATLLYSTIGQEVYLDAAPTTLPSAYAALEVMSIPLVGATAGLGLAAAAGALWGAHQISTLNSLASSYSLGTDGHLSVPTAPPSLPQGFNPIDVTSAVGDVTGSTGNLSISEDDGPQVDVSSSSQPSDDDQTFVLSQDSVTAGYFTSVQTSDDPSYIAVAIDTNSTDEIGPGASAVDAVLEGSDGSFRQVADDGAGNVSVTTYTDEGVQIDSFWMIAGSVGRDIQDGPSESFSGMTYGAADANGFHNEDGSSGGFNWSDILSNGTTFNLSFNPNQQLTEFTVGGTNGTSMTVYNATDPNYSISSSDGSTGNFMLVAGGGLFQSDLENSNEGYSTSSNLFSLDPNLIYDLDTIAESGSRTQIHSNLTYGELEVETANDATGQGISHNYYDGASMDYAVTDSSGYSHSGVTDLNGGLVAVADGGATYFADVVVNAGSQEALVTVHNSDGGTTSYHAYEDGGAFSLSVVTTHPGEATDSSLDEGMSSASIGWSALDGSHGSISLNSSGASYDVTDASGFASSVTVTTGGDLVDDWTGSDGSSGEEELSAGAWTSTYDFADGVSGGLTFDSGAWDFNNEYSSGTTESLELLADTSFEHDMTFSDGDSLSETFDASTGVYGRSDHFADGDSTFALSDSSANLELDNADGSQWAMTSDRAGNLEGSVIDGSSIENAAFSREQDGGDSTIHVESDVGGSTTNLYSAEGDFSRTAFNNDGSNSEYQLLSDGSAQYDVYDTANNHVGGVTSGTDGNLYTVDAAGFSGDSLDVVHEDSETVDTVIARADTTQVQNQYAIT